MNSPEPSAFPAPKGNRRRVHVTPLDGRPVPLASVGTVMPKTKVKLVGPNGEIREHIGEFWIKSPASTLG